MAHGFGQCRLWSRRTAQGRARRVAAAAARRPHRQSGAWPRELSGGQAQRVAIARTRPARRCCCSTDILRARRFTRADLQDHVRQGRFKPTLIMVTHDVDELVVLADRIIVMRPRPGRRVRGDHRGPAASGATAAVAAFDFVKRRVLAALDRSLDRAATPPRRRGEDLRTAGVVVLHLPCGLARRELRGGPRLLKAANTTLTPTLRHQGGGSTSAFHMTDPCGRA